jgi:hypothetical protein
MAEMAQPVFRAEAAAEKVRLEQIHLDKVVALVELVHQLQLVADPPLALVN